MKKLLAMLLALVMVLSFAACGQEETPNEPEVENPSEGEENPEEPTEPEVTAATYTLGMGINVSTGSSVTGTAQADVTTAVVVLDAEGKIADIEIDCAQTKVNMPEGVLEDLTAVDVRSKAEKKEDYGMAAIMGVPEWYVQVDALEEVLIGMTAEEVAAIELVEHNGHNVALNNETIYAACTMDLTGFKAAIAKACADEYAKEFTAESFELGLGVLTDVSESSAPADGADGTATLYTNFAGVVVDANGVVLADLLDMVQVKVAFNAAGEITTAADYDANFRSKKELKFDYNMVTYGGAIAEWFEQTLAVEEYFVGMNADEIAGLALYDHNGHQTFEAIVASCTMNVNEFQTTICKALANI